MRSTSSSVSPMCLPSISFLVLLTSIPSLPSEHGFLKGKRVVTSRRPVDASQDTEGETKPVPLMALTDLIIETVSNCSDETDDGVQLQVSLARDS
jgi:hypothetical protein